MEPVFIWQTEPTWFSPSAQQERTTARSSAQAASVRQPVADLDAGLAVLAEGPPAGEQRVAAGAHRRDDRAEAGRQLLAVQPGQLGLGVEGVEMTRPAFHEQEDDRLRPGLHLGRLRGERRRGRFAGMQEAIPAQQVGQSQAAEPAAGPKQKFPA